MIVPPFDGEGNCPCCGVCEGQYHQLTCEFLVRCPHCLTDRAPHGINCEYTKTFGHGVPGRVRTEAAYSAWCQERLAIDGVCHVRQRTATHDLVFGVWYCRSCSATYAEGHTSTCPHRANFLPANADEEIEITPIAQGAGSGNES